MTDAEQLLWRALRMRQLDSARYCRQVPLGRYIVDFACLEARLVIELDGGQHGVSTGYDEKRTAWLNERGWHVLRFWNNEVSANLEGVLETIRRELRSRAGFPHLSLPLQAGEGEVRS